MITKGSRRKLLTAIAFGLFLLFGGLTRQCEAQEVHKIQSYCVKGDCTQIAHGVVVIYDSAIFIKLERGNTMLLKYRETFRYKDKKYYQLKNKIYSGVFVVLDKGAFLELSIIGEERVLFETYHFKE